MNAPQEKAQLSLLVAFIIDVVATNCSEQWQKSEHRGECQTHHLSNNGEKFHPIGGTALDNDAVLHFCLCTVPQWILNQIILVQVEWRTSVLFLSVYQKFWTEFTVI